MLYIIGLALFACSAKLTLRGVAAIAGHVVGRTAAERAAGSSCGRTVVAAVSVTHRRRMVAVVVSVAVVVRVAIVVSVAIVVRVAIVV